MGMGQAVLLGAIAGLTIFLGLPLGRMRRGSKGLRTFLSGLSAGILVFLLFDILSHATEPVEAALVARSWASFGGLATLYVAGLGVGLLSIPYAALRLGDKSSNQRFGPGAMAAAEVGHTPARRALRLGMTIAVGIGLHNFSEGLAIGQSANAGEISLAVLLVVGFALHNATEGFGIVGPLSGAGVRASWSWLLLAGLIAGGPTFVGTLVGTWFSSEYVFVGFLALAAGAILYVVGELFASGKRLGWTITLWGVLAGFLLGLATDFVVAAAGG
jgi:ZIP family zinc transporter